MAWHAELKRRKWYCINGIDMISLYKQKIYDDWYNSLMDEQKQRLEEYRKAKAEKNCREAQEAIRSLLMMSKMVAGIYHRNDKYLCGSVKAAADFDSAISQVAAVSGVTDADFDVLRDKAREMGSKTKFSATEAAERMAMEIIANNMKKNGSMFYVRG